ncbi:tRNA (adenosine(37)-N6)-threonylcarbamoyltransferase complex dimerization subunit type 1 TsaB [Gordonia sp. VNK21]|uniref:tRNA (adenosine(37)-N6)-threonylcarbamoyltransferase complex dimerization subunit type 1 TsaB n=1 Tax=Gordonia sp. VNK21 TaxID=3382483 RepID=UPI0038D360C2
MTDTGGTATVLTIDTSTGSVVTGVVRLGPGGPRPLAQRVVDDHRRHAEVLTTLIKEALAEASVTGGELDAVIVGCGPGPFTGLRVGMATGAAYADALDLPVYGVCSLDAIAAAEPQAVGDGPVPTMLVVTDARRREVYWARYDHGRRVAGPEVSRPDELAAALAGDPPAVVVGDPAFTSRFGPAGTATVPTPAALAAVGAELLGTEPAPLTPLYLRRPDAVELKDQRRKSLL